MKNVVGLRLYKQKESKMKIYVALVCAMTSIGVSASDGNNIKACVDAASNYARVKLDSFSAAYEPRRIAMSRVRWTNAECEVKLGHVHNLIIDNAHVIYKGFAGKSAFDKSNELKNLNDEAIRQLRARIVLLEQNFKDIEKQLQSPYPDLGEISSNVSSTIERALRN
jgi:hypothetical protein